MGTKERQRRQKAELKQSILDAARDLFVEQGYEQVSMRKIAERIEYSPTTIYHHFHGKADLLYALVEETFAKLLGTLQALDKTYDDPFERLKESGRAFIHYGLAHPNHYKMAFMFPIAPRDDKERTRYLNPAAVGQLTFDYLRMLVADCVAQGQFRQVDVEMTAQALFAAVHGVTSLLIVHPGYPWVDHTQLIDYVLDSALGSFRKNTD